MAAGETAAVKAVWYALPLFIGAAAGLFLDPPKRPWALPILLLVFMGFGEICGPHLESHFAFFQGANSFARMTAAALGWTVLKMLQRAARTIDLAGMLPNRMEGK